MNSLRRFFIAAALLCAAVSCKTVHNHNYMWFDCEANYATLSHPDSIKFYLAKCKDLGFDNVVVDVKSIMSYVGASISVRGDVTKNAVIGTAWEGVSGVSGENMILAFNVVDGVAPEYTKLTLTGVQAIDWWTGYWCDAPGNYPGYAFLGTSTEQGGLLSVYNQNLLNYFDGTGACVLATETALADGNYAANSLDIREVGGQQYLAVGTGCHFPEYGCAPVVTVYNVATKEVVAVPQTTNYALTGEYDEDGNPLYKAGVCVTSDVVLEPAGDGFNVYYVDNNCAAIEAFHYAL